MKPLSIPAPLMMLTLLALLTTVPLTEAVAQRKNSRARTTASAPQARTEQPVMVGGSAMYASRDIVENVANSRDHSTLLRALKEGELITNLKSAGPYTVFAPVNGGFEKLPQGTLETLLRPENKALLTGLLNYHIVRGQFTTKDLARLVNEHMGRARLTTAHGGTLYITQDGTSFHLMDERGGRATITQSDIPQNNGVVHVVDAVLTPGG